MVIKQNFSKVLVSFVAMILMVALAGVVVFAAEEYDPVTVSFDTDGGSTVPPQEFQRYGSPTRPEDPTKDGCRFLGWYADALCTSPFDFEASCGTSTTVYAKWEVINYIFVSFEDGNGGYYASQKLEAGVDKPTVPVGEPEKDLHKFDGWYADAACTIPFDFDAIYTEDTLVYAKWIEYTVEVEKVDGVYTAIVFPQNEVTGYQWWVMVDEYNSEAVPDATQKTFNDGDSNKRYYCEVTFTGSSSLPSPKFDYVKTYFLTMKFPTYTSNVPIDEGKSFAQSYPDVDFSDIDKEHHTFLGWYRSDDEGQTFATTEYNFSQTMNEHITIYSRFEIDKHTVTYKADGVTVAEVLVPYGGDATAPAVPNKAGYTGVWDNDGTVVTSDRTINAVYTANSTSGGNGGVEAPTPEQDNTGNNNSVDGDLGVTGVVGWSLVAVTVICAGVVIVLASTKKKEA